MRAFYNENCPKTAAWLRQIIAEGLIADGIVDERSITEIQPHELDGYTQHHFFAGIGGWSYALRLAGVSDSTPVWTGSCPCQPVSSGGLRKGHADERHLWPAFYRFIAERKPANVFGEQVASPDGREWFSGIRADLEGIGYAVGGADLCAASVDLPHPRQRLFWFAHADSELDSGELVPQGGRQGANASIWQSQEILQKGQGRVDELVARRIAQRVSSYGEARSILNGLPGNMALMRGAGNAIVPQVAATFIQAALSALIP